MGNEDSTIPDSRGSLPEPGDSPGKIGPYHILDVLGEGGMGTVYRAEQRAPVKRRVALKLIKLGMDSKAVVGRFEQERQALALMDHESIARVFDCGTSDRGQPYFVMELVKGIPLDEFCEQQRLALPDRLQLMRQVCAAVQHAHQKGVVHRDLKPSNVLVSNESGRLQVKIIDFGLAKAMGQKLVEATLFTEAGQVVGTPEYMAPEQADPTNQDIDTRADIYSLGVMLYELLVGELPFPMTELRKAGMLEVQRILREVDPPKPSTKLTSMGEAATELARTRRISVGALQKALRTDLDWVVLKALEKDRNRRYDTANSLAADLQRYLDHEPLIAGPPSAGYRLKKLLRRYRGQLLAVGAVLATALTGAAVAVGLALKNAALAKAEATAKERFATKIREFNLLAAVDILDQVRAAAASLVPAWPTSVAAMASWEQDCVTLLALRPQIRAALAEIGKRLAAAQDTGGLANRAGGFLEVRRMMNSLQHAIAIHAGEVPLVIPELSEEELRMSSGELFEQAAQMFRPNGFLFEVGNEGRMLALTRRAWRLAESGDPTAPERHRRLMLLGAALMFGGQFDDAAELMTPLAAELDSDAARIFRMFSSGIHDGFADVLAVWEQLESASAGLFLQGTLTRLLEDLDNLERNELSVVRRDRYWADNVEGITRQHPNARLTWDDIRTSLGANPRYSHLDLELRDRDVLGLVPLGANPVTGYIECYHLRSAWNGVSDPREIPIPEHRRDGSIEVTGKTGIVFVLLPGGTVTLGSQDTDKDAAYHDPQHESDEALHEVALAPFLLARYELTQGQWARLWSGGTAPRQPSYYQDGQTPGGVRAITLANPVEQVDWSMCDELLSRHALVLPTEAQWEYGSRGGTTTPWFCDRAELRNYANLADATAEPLVTWTCEKWEDGHFAHAPVGSFSANDFGLHDVHGNVWEWCRDWYGAYGTERAGDGLRLETQDSNRVLYRVLRGGSFVSPAVNARSARRYTRTPTIRHNSFGLRPARTLRLPD